MRRTRYRQGTKLSDQRVKWPSFNPNRDRCHPQHRQILYSPYTKKLLMLTLKS